MDLIFRDSLNHRFLFHPTPSAVLPNFFASKQICQQVQFSAPNVLTAYQESSKGKSPSKAKEIQKSKPKAADWSVPETKQLLHVWAPRFERLKEPPTKYAQRFGTRFLNKIKEGFPYYSIFNQSMGYRDSVDPAKMEMDGSSSFMPIVSLNADSTPQIISSGAK